MQLNHHNTFFKKKCFPIILICENVTHASNIGSLFRIADAFGIEKIIFCGNDIRFSKKSKKTSRATEKTVVSQIRKSLIEVTSEIKKKNYQLIALEITTKSKPIQTYQFNTKAPIALIIGNENFGISKTILNICDETLHISMFGQNSSMNVVQAANIALYEITKQSLH